MAHMSSYFFKITFCLQGAGGVVVQYIERLSLALKVPGLCAGFFIDSLPLFIQQKMGTRLSSEVGRGGGEAEDGEEEEWSASTT